jgi:hypothetical protein
MQNRHAEPRRTLLVLVCSLAAACDAGLITEARPAGSQATGDESSGADGDPVPMVSLSFEGSDEDLLNPERGYYVGLDLVKGNGAAAVRAAGHTLAIALVRLDDYRHAPLDAALLAALGRGFADARESGVKIILRFMYNSSFSADASLSRILGHIDQLAPLLGDNADVIAVMQAGFIGAWGEWHGSTNGLDNDADRGAILRALLAALPASRAVQVRAPDYKEGSFPGGPLALDEAWSGSDRARLGHHNDCFLASDSDLGTYEAPVEDWKAYVAQDGLFTPIGGETCKVAEPRSDCPSATEEMAAHHWSYLNRQYNRNVLDRWTAQGCDEDVQRNLGYRLVARRLAYSGAVAPGGELAVSLELENVGYAAPFNSRPLWIVLRRGDQRYAAPLARDARSLMPGTSIVSTRLRVPAAAPAGDYELALWLPDAAPSLRDDPRYAIRLANRGLWDDGAGLNVLSRELRVDPSAPGPTDDGAAELVELR